jgi:hypothetical protein
MSPTFDLFAYLGYIIPGATLLLALIFIFPGLRPHLGIENIDLGKLGIFVIVAFIIGQLLSTISTYVISIPLRWSGYEQQTNRAICSLQIVDQRAIKDIISSKLGIDDQEMAATCKPGEWNKKRALVARIVWHVHQLETNKRERVALFEQYYYLNLNLAAAFTVILMIYLLAGRIHHKPSAWIGHVPVKVPKGRPYWLLAVMLLAAVVLLVHHVTYFDRLYARELVQVFIHIASLAKA